uniref:F-box domain-containing protein n=1 Tax=Parastrongyloides trichosuri TaxID=131310 RepID=A0A0N4ZQV5_PARTI
MKMESSSYFSVRSTHDINRIKVITTSNTEDMSSAEIVGRDWNLMTQIINQIPVGRERKNINLTCKMFYIISHDKRTFLESFNIKSKKKRLSIMPYLRCSYRTREIIKISNNTVTIGVPHFIKEIPYNFKQSLEKLKTVGFKLKKLELHCVPNEYVDELGKLNCFQNIDIVEFVSSGLKCSPLYIFKKCPELRPRYLIFADCGKRCPRSKLNNLRKKYIENPFPDSVQDITLDICYRGFAWLYYVTKNFKNGHFNKLSISDDLVLALLNENLRPKVLKVMGLFKHVDITCCNELVQFDIEQSINYVLGELNFILPLTKVTFNIELFCGDEDINFSEPVERPNVEKYLDIKTLRIQSPYEQNEFMKIHSSSLHDVFFFMKNLTTLIFGCDLISSFTELCTVLRSNLKNVGIFKGMSLKLCDIKKLSEYCKNIENLKLADISDKNISFKSIMSLLMNLKGLSIKYNSSIDSKDIICDLEKKNKDNVGCGVIEWPNLNILEISFSITKKHEELVLDKMEKQTPRKPGHLFITQTKEKDSSKTAKIVLQKHISYYDIFNDIINAF